MTRATPMKVLAVILMLAAAPAYAANKETCFTLANTIKIIADARDDGISKEASAELIIQATEDETARQIMLDANDLVYGSTATAQQLSMAMFNACMER